MTHPANPFGDAEPTQLSPQTGMSPDDATLTLVGARRPARPLRGWKKYTLIQALAKGEVSQRQMARDLGVNEASVREFRDRHRDEIAKARRDLENEFNALWIADKKHRLAEYQEDVERINESLPDGILVGVTMPDAEDGDGTTLVIEDKGTTALLRTKARILRNAAEEMGQLPARTNIQVVQPQTVIYAVEGVDLNKLK